jgi:hypothetical protein
LLLLVMLIDSVGDAFLRAGLGDLTVGFCFFVIQRRAIGGVLTMENG